MFCCLILIKKFILKNGLPSSKKVPFICFNKKPFKNDERCALFPVKMSLFVLKIFQFFLEFFGYVKSGLVRKLRFQNL